MKKYMMTAAALMLGSSALAWAPAEKSHLAGLTAAASAEWAGSATPLAFSALDKDLMKTSAIETATVAKGDELGMKSLAKWSDDDVRTAAGTTEKVGDDAAVVFADADLKSKDDVGGIQMASSVDATAATGMGGPIETATGYPACEPGPGDDRCIQLYEPGVHNALAAWKASDDTVGMGGPFEPAPATAKEPMSDHQGMDHGDADTSAGTATKTPSPTDFTPETDAAAKPAATTSPTPSAIGGPVEARNGYPPCRPGRGDDRCIQLYERGVTGRDN